MKGKPTVVVPFFGDQPFWGTMILTFNPRHLAERYVGAMIHESGAGPPPIGKKELDVENLTEALKFVMRPATETAARQLSVKIKAEVCL